MGQQLFRAELQVMKKFFGSKKLKKLGKKNLEKFIVDIS